MNNNKIKEAFKKSQSCNHQWDFIITPMENSNLFIEKCLKCGAGIETFEIIVK
jgi:hypothetical protein